jgi:hypothetical protein
VLKDYKKGGSKIQSNAESIDVIHRGTRGGPHANEKKGKHPNDELKGKNIEKKRWLLGK